MSNATTCSGNDDGVSSGSTAGVRITTCSVYRESVMVPAPKAIATARRRLVDTSPTRSSEAPMTRYDVPIVWARSNGVALCGATTSSHSQGPPVGVVPNIPPAISWSRSGPVAAGASGEPARSSAIPTGPVRTRDTTKDDQRQCGPGAGDPPLHGAARQVQAPERHPGQQVGQPRHDRVVAGEQELAQQLARLGELGEGRALEASRRELGPDHL